MRVRPCDPGRDAPECLQGGAEAVPERLGRLQSLSFIAIHTAGANGLTAIEAATATGFDRYSIQPRLSELRRKGRIVDSGLHRRNPSGRQAIVWIAREAMLDG